ncbi:MAG: ABC transporter permease subunit [Myxococcota bacterium]
MTSYFIRRFLLLIPTFIGITFLVFAITRFVPGGPIDQMMAAAQGAASEAGGGGGGATTFDVPQSVIDAMNERYGFDKPFYVAYFHWLGDVLTGNLGTSYKFNLPVLGLIVSRFPVSLYFGLIGFFLAYSVCIPLGIYKAILHSGRFDIASSALVFVGYSIPGWALGGVLLVLLGGGSFLDLVPLGGFRSENWNELSWFGKIVDQLHHTILPVISYAVAQFAVLTMLMKNSLMENLGQDYVRTAFAKGLSERRVIWVHVLRNSLIPISTGLGHALSVVMAGSYLVEKVFNIDGVGYLGFISIVERDYAVVMGILVINVVLLLLGNIISDVLYVLVDPRIRFN